MKKSSDNRKLLVGLCLLLISDKVMCTPLSAYQEDQITKKFLTYYFAISREGLACPHLVNEIESCISRKKTTKSYDFCTGIREEWDCFESGLRKCQDGARIRELAGTTINEISILLGCPAVAKSVPVFQHNDNARETHGPLNGSWRLKPKTVLVMLFIFVCLVAGLMALNKKERNSEAQAVNV